MKGDEDNEQAETFEANKKYGKVKISVDNPVAPKNRSLSPLGLG